MVFDRKRKQSVYDINIKIGDKKINEVQQTKFLGIIVDNKLTWNNHISVLTTKIAKSIGILLKCRKYLEERILLNLYYSFIYPYLLYGNLIWGNAATTLVEKVGKKQKLAIRIIFNMKRKQSISAICKKYEIIKIQDIYHYVLSIFMHKIENDKTPEMFKEMFIKN